jgi:hypothetical protein
MLLYPLADKYNLCKNNVSPNKVMYYIHLPLKEIHSTTLKGL